MGGLPRGPRPDPLPERAAASPQGGLPGHRARADEHPGHRQLQDQRPDRLGADPLRRQAAQQGPARRDPRYGDRPGRGSRGEGQGRPAPAAVHRLAAAGGGGAVPGAPAAAGRHGAFRLHLDPDVPQRSRGPVRRAAAGGRRPRRHRRRRLRGHDEYLRRHRAVLVPGLRPRPGQEDAGRLQAAAPERLRQAAPVRLALQGRRRGPGVDGPAPGRRRHRGQHRRGRAGRRLHQGRDGHDRPALR